MINCDVCNRVACLLETPSPCELEEQQDTLELDRFLLQSEAERLKKLMDEDSTVSRKIREWKESLKRYRIIVRLNVVYTNLDGVTLILEQIFPEEKRVGSMFYYFNVRRQSVSRHGGGQIILSRSERWTDDVLNFSSEEWEDLTNGKIHDDCLAQYLRGKVSEIVVEQS